MIDVYEWAVDEKLYRGRAKREYCRKKESFDPNQIIFWDTGKLDKIFNFLQPFIRDYDLYYGGYHTSLKYPFRMTWIEYFTTQNDSYCFDFYARSRFIKFSPKRWKNMNKIKYTFKSYVLCVDIIIELLKEKIRRATTYRELSSDMGLLYSFGVYDRRPYFKELQERLSIIGEPQ